MYIQAVTVIGLSEIGTTGPKIKPPVFAFELLNAPTYCGSIPLHCPSRDTPATVLDTWHDPACACGWKFPDEKTPSWKSTDRTTAMMSIAHPYVIKYSIADWDFTGILSLALTKKRINSLLFRHSPLCHSWIKREAPAELEHFLPHLFKPLVRRKLFLELPYHRLPCVLVLR